MRKKERFLSILVVPHHKEGQINFHISYRTLRWLAAAGLLLMLIIAGLVVNYGRIFWRAGQYELMLRRHQQMEAEFHKLQGLKHELARLQQQEEKVRQMLGVASQPETLTLAQVSGSGNNESPDTPVSNQDRFLPCFMPTKGWISSGLSSEHQGVDIAARQGQPVMAPADGIVASVEWDNYFGNKLTIKHGDRYLTVYGHCHRILVQPQQAVRRGQLIALVGSSGQSTGPHLHYEIHQDGKIVDPSSYWIAR